ncbi:4'-phosphopantetheinyl transferase superfamily protein [Odoribacter sp. OttesenSCG-928-L07]|nr:4'-phosphopantetheinyl transferase superfamily protein [Odoribacter sp. OttesenSCG-928-L07]
MKTPDYHIIFSEIVNPNDILSFLTDEDIEYIDRISNEKLRSQSATARFLIRKYLKENFSNNYKEFRIDLESNGKPFFRNTDSLSFSISHSGEQIVVLLSKSKCGIDIESVKNYRKEIAKRFFHKTEFEYLESINDTKKQAEEFYRIWTVKEAVLKLTGKGISGGLSSFYLNGNGHIISKSDMTEKISVISEKQNINGILYYYSIALAH